jgi:hypothetical protein
MLPFLGRGDRGAERGVKLALIGKMDFITGALLAEIYFTTAGIKESLYDIEALVAYLLYRLNVLNPICASALSYYHCLVVLI